LEQIMAQVRSQTVGPQALDPAPSRAEANDAKEKGGRRRNKNKI
jgi:hypothetical protein